ncbi:TonB-dependent receptor [Pontibacter sp. BT310]|uniref:TonB-dependent receptor n=1 Tax=Pontibacter populi TaxID=890055 RepID=A0ABS6X6I3_9BACT|nr:MULTISPECIES: TonB-dependent receptor [Pontibacter]MBJ6116750.1 TonB-dependent receptor [Pontibacter sp. BT310]MBR0569173.1 TonB-dependent receptor [Microvirga sp. STS03]MBW3363604.1 TonB-dependent receptor [Pontibacter populi]
MKQLFTLLLLSCSVSITFAQSKHTISGYVREKGSGEQLIGVSIFQPDTVISTSTNTYGFYSLTLPATDSITLTFGYLGYKQEVRTIALSQNIELNIDLQRIETSLKEVEVVAERVEKVSRSVEMSKIDVPVSQIKNIPMLLGEKDVMKVLQLMPGVQKGSEGNSGIYVRGGGPDQNLIILDDATVYNASHLFGFFSLFNGDALKSVELTKGGFPARYGGRLSSVIELNMKEGNKEELHGEGGIGLISSRLMVEGPLKQGKSSFLISGRRTYADVLARPFMPNDAKVGYYFYDLNTKVNYDFGRKNKLYLSGYFGQDRFYYKDKDEKSESYGGVNWGNATGTLRWNHLFNEQLFSNTSLVFSRYKFNILAEEKDKDESRYELNYFSGIQDAALKFDVDYLPGPKNSVKAGLQSTFHMFTPSALVVKDPEMGKDKENKQLLNSVESSVYVEDTYKPTPDLRINAGLRLSHFAAKNKSYFMPEPRLSAAYNLRDDLAVKASYARMNQYVHLISNTGIGLPTDLWVPTTDRLAPQKSQQVALGVAKDFLEKDLALTIEGYYKKSDNIIGYKEGASFLIIEDPESAEQVSWEDNITTGQGWSYGLEFLLQKKVGRFSGWAGYTLSWTQLQFDSLNYGKKFYARYDRRHDISLVGIYELRDNITLSGTWVYGTGNAITMPIGTYMDSPNKPSKYDMQWYSYYSNTVVDYGERNSSRMAAYHRMDVGIQFHKKKKWGERTWEISFYNAYNRKNPFFYYMEEEYYNEDHSETKLKQVALFPIIPSVSYGFKF